MQILNESVYANKLNSDLLRTFVAVAESGGVSNATERVFRSQSAISIQVKQLEEIIGQQLFDRRGRGVTLNAAGKRLLPKARDIIRLLDEAYAEIRPMKLSGVLRIGIPDEYAQAALTQMIARFSQKCPAVKLVVKCSLSAQFPAALRRGELDVAIFDVAKPQSRHEIIRRQHLVWAASREHAAQTLTPTPIALFDRDCWWRNEALKALKQTKKKYEIAFSSESARGVIAAIQAGIAVGVISADEMRPEFLKLSSQHGFPALAQSTLVLETRKNADDMLVAAFLSAVRSSFAY